MAKFTLVCSIVAILVGIGTIVASAPDFNFPHSMGGAIITGVMGLLQVWSTFALIREARRTLSEDTATTRFQTLYCVKIVTVILMLYLTLAPAVGISGIWGIVDCNKKTRPDNYNELYSSRGRSGRSYLNTSFSRCEPNKQILYMLAIASFVIGILVYFMILFMCCTFNTKARAFGIKSNYEKFLDYMAQKSGQTSHTVGQLPPFQQTYGVSGAHGLKHNPIFQQQPTTVVTEAQFRMDNSQYVPPPPPTYREIIN